MEFKKHISNSARGRSISLRLALSFFLACALLAQGGLALATHSAGKSVARQWNEVLLSAIRVDVGRPTVHARNLFHTSAAMYDLWAVYDNKAEPYFLGNTHGGYHCKFSEHDRRMLQKKTRNEDAARSKAISFAMYRLLHHRFKKSPGYGVSSQRFDDLFNALGYDSSDTSTNFRTGSASALGNYLANCIIEFGLQDNSNEANNYASLYYQPVNGPTNPANPGVTGIFDMDNWQPLSLNGFDSSGNPIVSTPGFLSPEWGKVTPFSLRKKDLTVNWLGGVDYWVYHDPGFPALMNGINAQPEEYQWNHSLVAHWSSHLDPADGITCDISPATLGNTSELPTTLHGLRDFYETLGYGCSVNDQGHKRNPATRKPYAENIVARGDYTRVLAEFWADGPNSETPPGHWYTMLNSLVSDHPKFKKQFAGRGKKLDDLEWDVKAYFVLGGGLHDAAVTVWGIKSWYDYVRPFTAIRYMGSLGQSSDSSRPNYDPRGIPLSPGLVEVVEQGDPLAGDNGEHVGKIKLYAWRGPAHIANQATDVAGVGWILAENWWPYQRPGFVTPPFAGYISGHSTFSRTAAEILTYITGDEYFPGGMGEFTAKAHEFLVFEDGPSQDITLQWATYRDASDQTSLSRIWGGIHPPVDDIPGRLIGIELGESAFKEALRYFNDKDHHHHHHGKHHDERGKWRHSWRGRH